jgi:hypothetical protein
MEANEIKDVLSPMIKGVQEQVSGEIKAIDKKLEDRVNEINEAGKKTGETLAEIKKQVDEVSAKAGKLKADVVDQARAGWNSSDHFKSAIVDMIAENYDSIKTEKAFKATKAVGNMTLSGNLTGTSQISYIPNAQMRSIQSNPRLYELFKVIPTATGNVTFPRGNSPVGEGSFGAQTEGSAKAQVDLDVTMVNVSVPFIAGYAKVSRQMLQDLPFLQSYLSMSLVEDFNQAVNTRFLNTIASGATSSGSTGTYTSEKFVISLATHGALGLGQANLILTTWTGWSQLLNTKPADFSTPGGVVIDANGSVRIAGVPVVPHIQCTPGRFYTLNTDAFAIAQAEGFTVRSTETDQDDFIKNLVTYRAEARIELLSFQPTAAVYGNLGS